MVTKYLETGLGVWIESGLVLQLGDTDFLVKLLHDTQQVAQTDVSVSDNTLDLVELSQVCRIQSLISEDSINREVLHGFELLLLS